MIMVERGGHNNECVAVGFCCEQDFSVVAKLYAHKLFPICICFVTANDLSSTIHPTFARITTKPYKTVT